MQHLLDAQAEAKRIHWLDHVETLSVIGSVGGAIAAAITEQVALASIPLSLTATLHLANRRRLTAAASQVRQTTISHLSQQEQENKAQFASLTQNSQTSKEAIAKLNHLDEDKQLSISALTKQNQSQQQTLDTLGEKLGVAETTGTELKEQTQELQKDSEILKAREERLSTALKQLHEIDQLTQLIRKTPKDATLYYRRGLVRGSLARLDDQRIAIEDYTQAITLDAEYADAYFQRGALKGMINEKKQAVSDLRIAAKIFFEMGDLEKYDQAMSLSQEQHDMKSGDEAPVAEDAQMSEAEVEAEEPLMVGGLFD